MFYHKITAEGEKYEKIPIFILDNTASYQYEYS